MAGKEEGVPARTKKGAESKRLASASGSSDEEEEFTDDDESSGVGSGNDASEKRQSHTECALRLLIQRCPSAALRELLTAHADLDDMHQQQQQQQQQQPTINPTVWRDVHGFLKRCQSDRAAIAAEVKRDFRRTRHCLGFDRVDELARSIDRLLARVDVLFSNQRGDGARWQSLTSPERRALNASMQIWRKTFRGCSNTFDGSPTSRIETCIETSLLYNKDDLVVCTNGQSGRMEGVEAAASHWNTLKVCCVTVAQWNCVLSDLLPFGVWSRIVRVTVQPHCRPIDGPPIHFTSVPPCVLDKSIVVFSGVDIKADTKAMLGAAEVLAVVNRHFETNDCSPYAVAPSLAASCIGVLRQHRALLATHSAASPPHLRTLMVDAYRCVSCRRTVLPPASVRNTLLSKQFQRAAHSAGFSTRHEREKLLRASLREQSLWLPPFKETLLCNKACDGAVSSQYPIWIHMAGTQSEEEPLQSASINVAHHNDEDDLAWRFCVPCGAAHIAQSEQYGRRCRCYVCVWETQCGRNPDFQRAWVRFRAVEDGAN